MNAGWKVNNYAEGIHVVPVDDAGEHEEISIGDTSPICNCLCGPRRLKENNKYIFIHSSFDGREGLEWATEILNK